MDSVIQQLIYFKQFVEDKVEFILVHIVKVVLRAHRHQHLVIVELGKFFLFLEFTKKLYANFFFFFNFCEINISKFDDLLFFVLFFGCYTKFNKVKLIFFF